MIEVYQHPAHERRGREAVRVVAIEGTARRELRQEYRDWRRQFAARYGVKVARGMARRYVIGTCAAWGSTTSRYADGPISLDRDDVIGVPV